MPADLFGVITMRLKSLKLAGFKSFANPTTFTFRHDITAIVGPNGCGKSNVIDAIRWVLGETSAKQLRGGAMSDVIFAGVEGRAAKSLASVELVFEHTQDEKHGIRHELNLYQELSLRRQVTKDGKSTYFINGQQVRRRDVVDVFLGTGLGARSYAVIEQGMIGRIVDSSPMQLREFIEEGAGVSRYQARRVDTEKKLAETRENLQRLSDLQGELKKQQKTLARQAESAKQYNQLNDKLHILHHEDLLRRLFEAWQYHELKKGEQGKSAEVLAALEAQVGQARKRLDEHSARVLEAQWLKDDARDKYHNAQMAEQTAQHNFLTVNNSIAQNDEKIARLKNTHAEAMANIEHAKSELEQLTQQLDELLPQAQQAQRELELAKDTQNDAQNAWQAQRDELNALMQQKNALQTEQKLLQTQVARVQESLEKSRHREEQLAIALQNLANTDTEASELKKQQAVAQSLRQRLDGFGDEQELKAGVDKLQQLVNQHQAATTAQDKQHASLMGEYEILHKLVHTPAPKAKQDTAVNADMVQELESLPALQTALSLTAKGRDLAGVLDKFLGFWLGARLADNPSVAICQNDAQSVKLILKSGKKSDKGVIASALYASDLLAKLPQSVSSHLVRLDELIATPTLEIFTRCYLYLGDTLPDELDCTALVGVMILTKTGWLLGSFGMMHISKLGDESGEFLVQRNKHLQRLAELDDELNALEEVLGKEQKLLKQTSGQLQTAKVELEELLAQKNAATVQLHHAEKMIATLTAKIDNEQIRRESLLAQHEQLTEEKKALSLELQQLQVQQQQCQEKLAEFAPLITLANQSMSVQTLRIDEVNALLKQRSETHNQLQLQINTLSQNKTHAERLLEMAKTSLAKTQADSEATKRSQDELHDKLPELLATFKQAQATSHELKVASDEYEAATKVLQLGQAKLQEELTDCHNQFTAAQTAAAQVSADTAVGESRLQDLADELTRFDEAFNLPAMLADFRANPNRQFVDNFAERERLKEQIAKLGAVNLAAAAELAELEARVSPMDEQIADITKSMTKLEDAIRTIDEKTKSLFLGALSAVNEQLNALFSKVFGGGQASLSLMEDDSLPKADKWRAGLVLMAQPKGKKNSRLAVLSGGEKTLTALSLIFAIFKQHPAPFCVLDEVDAPLDDANVARFTGLIRELACDVQFIFISHNKLAMQIADELKGITMPTAGISSLVTVDLQEAEKYLEPAV